MYSERRVPLGAAKLLDKKFLAQDRVFYTGTANLLTNTRPKRKFNFLELKVGKRLPLAPLSSMLMGLVFGWGRVCIQRMTGGELVLHLTNSNL